MPSDVSSIVHVAWSGGVGGIGRLIHDVALRQRQDGLDVSVAFAQARGRFADALEQQGVAVVDLGIASGYDVRPRRLAAAAGVLRRFDVVHLHGFDVPCALALLASRRPIVFTEHGNFGLGRQLHPDERVKRRLQRAFLARRCAAVVGNSHHTARRVHELYGLEPSRITVIYNGIVAPTSVPSGRSPGAPLTAGFVGRLVSFKRVDRLLRAAALVDAPPALRVLVVGDGPLADELRALSTRLRVEDRVEFLGHREDLGRLLGELDVIVQPSMAEPFGLALAEGCSHGALPVAFADGGGALEVLPPDGVVVKDVEALALLLAQSPDSPLFGDEARATRAAWIRDAFPIGRCADAYIAVYDRVWNATESGVRRRR